MKQTQKVNFHTTEVGVNWLARLIEESGSL